MHSIAWWPTLFASTVATVWDVRSRRIPNWLVFPFLIAGIAVSTITKGWSGLTYSVFGILTAALLLGLLHMFAGMGMGDVKLCAAMGAWIGPHQLLFAVVFMGLAGGIIAFACMLWNPAVRKIPYAPAIAIGTVVSFFAAL